MGCRCAPPRVRIRNNLAQFVGLGSCYTGSMHQNPLEYAVLGRKRSKLFREGGLVRQPERENDCTLPLPAEKFRLRLCY